MTDIRSMVSKMGKGAGDGQTNGQAVSKKPNSIENTYQKKSQLEHILLRPDTYIGSVEHVTENMWVYDEEKKTMVQRDVTYVPGLYKIFDEILVNAADNKQRDKNMDCIKIEIKPEENLISVWNNGQGIPVVMHKEENMYVPTMIFGHLLTSSNYNDEEEKVTGGRNGYGAKLCNIFSTKFTVETSSYEYRQNFKQTWGSNMTKASEPKVKDSSGNDFTKITFCPDLSKFKMEKLDDDIVGLMSRRAFDIAASTRGVKVFLNGTRVPVKTFKDYIDFYIKSNEEAVENGTTPKIVHEIVNDRWEVAMTLSTKGFQQVSFVNSIATTKGGRHVDYIADALCKQIMEVVNKKNKNGAKIKNFQIKSNMWIFINCLIVNPTFDSQTKENMTLQAKSFGSKCALSEKFVNNVIKTTGIIEMILSWAQFKAQSQLAKASGKKQSKIKGVPKLEDANEAGTKNAMKCTLILTEGDSAKSLAVSGLGVIGRDYYGVFPLRGKLLNVREATHKQILENAEINNLIKICGLQYNKKYRTEDDMKTLRYGKIMIMTDQDQDGSHIKGLLINFIHYNWPDLLKMNFLEEFITPIVKAKKRNSELSFYSLPEFEEWKKNTDNHSTYEIKYYKGLGTSTSKEAKEYFSNMDRHRIRFKYNGQQDDDHIILAFSKKHIEHRKEWLTNFMIESKRRKELGIAENYLYTKDTKCITYTDFINLELILFSNMDNVRSIPCLVDGLKPGQRKVIFTCIKRNDKREVKVAQLAGSVAEHSAYHHGEQSLCMTIVGLAQNYVGSNNINLLEPRGQFGTRLTGGKDSASPRYIFTKMSPLTRLIIHPNDDPLLKHEYDDNQKIEPTWYIPIIPMILVNGAEGIGTGWSTKIPNYNPREIVRNLRCLLNNESVTPMIPWYKNYRGTVDDCGDSRYVTSGEIAIIDDEKLEITELPISVWTQTYKENVLEILLNGTDKVPATITDYKEYNTDTTVKFVVKVSRAEFNKVEKEGFHKVFKLQNTLSISSMCLFDDLGCLRKFESVMDILSEYYQLRLNLYVKRKDYLEGMLEAEASKLSFQARFILEKCNGDLVVENKKRKTIIDDLLKVGYLPDPVKEWKERQAIDEDAPLPEDDVVDEDEAGASEKNFSKLTDVKKFDYLLGMSMWMLTDEKKNDLLKQRDQKLTELATLKKKTNADLWREDLDALMEKLDSVEEKERKDELGEVKTAVVKGSKKKNLNETRPTAHSERIAPIISEDMKKKIQTAAKANQRKIKKVKSEGGTGEEEDEFDNMVKSTKTIKDKVGTPESVEAKNKRGKKKAPSKDGMKQTTLNFTKVSPKANGKGKGKKKNFSDDSASGSDEEFVANVSSPPKDRSRRNITQKKYNIDDSDASNHGIENDDDDDLELLDNEAVTKDNSVKEAMIINSDSDEEPTPPPKSMDNSEVLFDELIGKKKTPAPKRKRAIKDKSQDDSDDDFEIDSKKTKPKASAKKKKVVDSDFEDEISSPPAKPAGRGRAKKAAKYFDDGDSDSF